MPSKEIPGFSNAASVLSDIHYICKLQPMATSYILRAIFQASLISSIAASLDGNITKDLRPLLSSAAEIYYPGSVGYTNATMRWSAEIKPGLDVVVKVASEKDVQATVSPFIHPCLSHLLSRFPTFRSEDFQPLTHLSIGSNTPTPTPPPSSPSAAVTAPLATSPL